MRKTLCLAILLLCMAVMLCGCSLDSITGADRQVSSSDALSEEDASQWEAAESDADYTGIAQDKLDVFIEDFTKLSAEKERLSKIGGRNKVLRDSVFSELSGELTAWCDGACSYSEASLSDEQSKEVCRTAVELGGLTKEYLEVYPDIVSGSYKGEKTAEEYENEIVDLAVSMFELLYA